MSWAAVAGAAIGVVGSSMSDSGGGGGGAGTSSQSVTPWAPAQPWMMSNLASGQALQNQYTAQPFSQAQLRAYGNLGATSDYARQIIPSLMGTASRQQLGFDRSNPNARPEQYRFDAQVGGTPGATSNALTGLLGTLQGQSQSGLGAENPAPQEAQGPRSGGLFTQTPGQDQPGDFMMQQRLNGTTGNMTGVAKYGHPNYAGATGIQGAGGYGEFKYGMQPAPGSQAETDLRMYMSLGGQDPLGLYSGSGQTDPWGMRSVEGGGNLARGLMTQQSGNGNQY